MRVVTVPTIDDVMAARRVLAGSVRRTPVLRSDDLDQQVGVPIVAKAECLQVTGSFKVRGALNRIRTLTAEQRAAGLITVSAGNAALGAAQAARMCGASLFVVMPENAVPEKLAAVRRYGATVVCEGVRNAHDAFATARTLVDERGLTFVHPFDDPMVIAGAATATVELLEDEPGIERLLVPCSGGGLISGAILGVRTVEASVEIVGVQPTGADAIVRSLAAGEPVKIDHAETIADGLTAPGPGEVPFAVIKGAGIDVVTVPDERILEAMALIVRTLRVVIEPSAAAGVAALLEHPELRKSRAETGVLLSGSNVRWPLLAELLSK